MKARHVLVVADACYSGSLLRSPSAAERMFVSDAAYLNSMMQGRSRPALTSGTLQPVLDEGGSGHSVFAAAFVKYLKQNHRIIDMDRLTDDIIQEVETLTERTSQQQPRYYMIMPPIAVEERGDFVFVPKGEVLH
jgi:hypothetical protein